MKFKLTKSIILTLGLMITSVSVRAGVIEDAPIKTSTIIDFDFLPVILNLRGDLYIGGRYLESNYDHLTSYEVNEDQRNVRIISRSENRNLLNDCAKEAFYAYITDGEFIYTMKNTFQTLGFGGNYLTQAGGTTIEIREHQPFTDNFTCQWREFNQPNNQYSLNRIFRPRAQLMGWNDLHPDIDYPGFEGKQLLKIHGNILLNQPYEITILAETPAEIEKIEECHDLIMDNENGAIDFGYSYNQNVNRDRYHLEIISGKAYRCENIINTLQGVNNAGMLQNN